MRFMVTQPPENQPHYLRGYAADGDEEWVKRLLNDGVDVNDKDEYGMTALHLASAANNNEIVKILVSHGASPEIVNLQGQTPVHLSAANGHLDILKQLLNGLNKETLDLKAKKSGHTALHYASRHGHAEACRILLQHGATKHISDAVRLPPAKYAKNVETRNVFEEKSAVPAVATPRQSKIEAPKPPTTTVPKPKPTNETPTRGRSRSSDPPRAARSKDPSAQRQERVLEANSNNIEASANDYGQGKLKRNEVSIFSENISREKEEVGPVIVDKKKETASKELKDKKITFSDAHKKRMQMSVFDRLAGGPKKK